jgi:RNA polymerase sigma factor (sigma-70 family)
MTEIAQKKRKADDKARVDIILNGTPREKERAYAELYKDYEAYLSNYFYKNVYDRVKASDLAIEALGKAFTSLDKFDSKYAFSTWMQKIARNLLIDYKRKQEIEVSSFDDLGHTDEDGKSYAFDVDGEGRDPHEELVRQNSHTELHEKMSKLKPRYQQVLKLYYLQEMTSKEIASVLKSPIGTIKPQLMRAKEALLNLYLEEEELAPQFV